MARRNYRLLGCMANVAVALGLLGIGYEAGVYREELKQMASEVFPEIEAGKITIKITQGEKATTITHPVDTDLLGFCVRTSEGTLRGNVVSRELELGCGGKEIK